MASAEAAFDAIEGMADNSAEVTLSLVEFSLLDEKVFNAFADGAHARWGT